MVHVSILQKSGKKNKTVQMFCSYYTKIYYKNKFRNEHIPEFIFYRQ